MANEVVKYHNDLNKQALKGWTKAQQDFFFAVLSKAKEKGTGVLEFDTNEIHEMIKFSTKDETAWKKTIRSMGLKVASVVYYEESEDELTITPLFKEFKTSYKNHTVTVQLNEKFGYILNNFGMNFTRFELDEIVGIRSTYAKTMFRLVKQWRTVGELHFTPEKFRKDLGIPESYPNSKVTIKVVNPINKELSQVVPGFKLKIDKSRRKGSPVIGYIATWEAETTGEWEKDKFKKNKYAPKKAPLPEYFRDDYQEPQVEITEEEIENVQKQLKSMADSPVEGQISMFDDIPM